MRTCKADKCDNNVFSMGYCKYHQYKRKYTKRGYGIKRKRTAIVDKGGKGGKGYKEVYSLFFDVYGDDSVLCEGCSRRIAVDIHHIVFRSSGGGNDIGNLVALCRECHNKCHSSRDYNREIEGKHKVNIDIREKVLMNGEI